MLDLAQGANGAEDCAGADFHGQRFDQLAHGDAIAFLTPAEQSPAERGALGQLAVNRDSGAEILAKGDDALRVALPCGRQRGVGIRC